jgi:transcriptional regulator with XRE-family HTH domain
LKGGADMPKSQTFRDLIKSKGMTQAELAKKIGVSERAIEHWCCGTRIPNLKYAYYIASALGVNLEDLAIVILYGEKSGASGPKRK